MEAGELEMRFVRALFIVAALSIMAMGTYHARAKAQSQEAVRVVVVPAGNSDVSLPPGDIVGFSCAAGLKDVQPSCYILIK